MPDAVRRCAPERTCIGCRRVASPDELVRVVARPDGSLAVGRNLPGRGAWLCAGSLARVDLAGRRRALSRALRTEVRADAVAALREDLAERARIEGGPLGSGARADHDSPPRPGPTPAPGTAT